VFKLERERERKIFAEVANQICSSSNHCDNVAFVLGNILPTSINPSLSQWDIVRPFKGPSIDETDETVITLDMLSRIFEEASGVRMPCYSPRDRCIHSPIKHYTERLWIVFGY